MTSYVRISTPSPRRELARLGVRADVEADDDRVGRGREHDVVLRDRPRRPRDDVEPHLRSARTSRARETTPRPSPATSPLEDDGLRSETSPAWSCSNSLSRETPAGRADASCSRRRRSPRWLASSRASRSFVDDARQLARRRRLVEAEDLDRLARTAPPRPLARVVEERLARGRTRRRRRSRRRP